MSTGPAFDQNTCHKTLAFLMGCVPANCMNTHVRKEVIARNDNGHTANTLISVLKAWNVPNASDLVADGSWGPQAELATKYVTGEQPLPAQEPAPITTVPDHSGTCQQPASAEANP